MIKKGEKGKKQIHEKHLKKQLKFISFCVLVKYNTYNHEHKWKCGHVISQSTP